jgi:hypothetical protein
VNKIFTSPSVWTVRVDTSAESPENEICGWPKGLVLFISTDLFKSLKTPRITLPQSISQTEKACFKLFSVPLISSVKICPCDKTSLGSNISVINRRCDKMSV